jgi:hypothetical protein
MVDGDVAHAFGEFGLAQASSCARGDQLEGDGELGFQCVVLGACLGSASRRFLRSARLVIWWSVHPRAGRIGRYDAAGWCNRRRDAGGVRLAGELWLLQARTEVVDQVVDLLLAGLYRNIGY